MNYQELLNSLTPELVQRLRSGVETGRWPDGTPLTPEQREHSLQAVIAWDEQHLPEEERVGYVDTSRKQGAKAGAQAMRWVDDTSGSD